MVCFLTIVYKVAPVKHSGSIDRSASATRRNRRRPRPDVAAASGSAPLAPVIELAASETLAKAASKAHDEIRIRILDGRLAPGERLREHVLAMQIGVSRTPIREALRRLAADGYVTLIANQGASVTEWTDQSLADLVDVRAELAAMATRRATARIDETQIGQLRALNTRMAEVAERRAIGFLTEAAELNIAFHRIIWDASGNPWIRQLLDQTAYLPLVQRAHHAFDELAWSQGIARYVDLVRAFETRDAEWAATLIKSHFLAAKHSILHHRSKHGT